MKILHVCESIIGGTGSYLAELIPHQVQRYGRDNIILLVPYNQLAYLERSILDAGPQLITFRRPVRLLGTFFLLVQYLIALFRHRPDIVHAHSSIAGFVVRSVRTRLASSIVFCPHGWSVDMGGRKHVTKIATWIEQRLGRYRDKILLISQHEYDRALELGLAPDKLVLIPNGIERRAPDVDPAVWIDDRIKVLYAGRFDHQKGIDVLLQAVADLDDVISLRLVGDFAVSEVKLPDELPACATRLGWLDREGVVAQMKSCDVLVVPSRWEGFGLVAIEAMRESVPVLASAVGGLKEILGYGRYGYLVPAEDVGALRTQLRNLTKSALHEKGAIGHERFLAAYTSDRMVRQIDELYSSLIGVKASSAPAETPNRSLIG